MEDARNIIAGIVEKHVDLFHRDPALYKKSLSDLGMESMEFVHIIVDIEEKFEIEIPDDMLFRGELDSILQLTEVVLKLLGVDIEEVENGYN